MSSFIKKENLTISTGEYQKDGQTKKEWRTIGELITMQGDDGQPYQFFKMWGAGGVVEGKVFEQQDRNQQAAPQQSQQQNGFSNQPQQSQSTQNAAYVQQPQQQGFAPQGQQQGFPQHSG
tara:strand:- start:1516 stop:1875 length:360 start_codon:yes stop_codon:yes gene_type:complete